MKIIDVAAAVILRNDGCFLLGQRAANHPVVVALRLPALYGITHAWQIGVDAQLAALEVALHGGLRLVQCRENNLPDQARRDFAAAAVQLCHAQGARLLVNGDPALAIAVGADGVHFPAHQMMALHARPALPLVAASCHNRKELDHAAALGLDFVVMGPVKSTATHPDKAGIGWPAFEEAIENYPLPVYALGGLTVADRTIAQASGAQGVAAIRAAW